MVPVYLQIPICCHWKVGREGMIKPSLQTRKLRLRGREELYWKGGTEPGPGFLMSWLPIQ